MKPEIYADGQPVYGIGELSLDMLDPSNPPEVVRVASPMEATVRMNLEPGKVFALLTESARQAAEAFRKLVEAVNREIGLHAVKPYWYHMSQYAKKAKVRKKYRSRIMREWNRQDKEA